MDGFFYRFTKCRCPDCPLWGKPAGRAFHTHPEFRQSGGVQWDFCGPESVRIIDFVDAPRVVSDSQPAPFRRIKFNIDSEPRIPSINFLNLCPIIKKTLDGIVDKFGDGKPRFVVEMTEYGEYPNPRTNLNLLWFSPHFCSSR